MIVMLKLKLNLKNSIDDFRQSIKRLDLVFMLGWQDIKQRYRRSKLGPFWLTISMGVVIATIGIVFGQVFNASMSAYLPYLSLGIIIWSFLSTCLLEGSSTFIDSSGMIRQLSLPLMLYPLRTLWRNIIILGHNILIYPFVLLIYGHELNWNMLYILPSAVIFLINVFWMMVFLGTCCTRFRDMPQIINSFLQVCFYVTPVIWMPNSLSPRSASLLTDPNPIYHLIEIIRAPLLGNQPAMISVCVTSIMAVLGTTFILIFFGQYKKRISYWL